MCLYWMQLPFIGWIVDFEEKKRERGNKREEIRRSKRIKGRGEIKDVIGLKWEQQRAQFLSTRDIFYVLLFAWLDIPTESSNNLFIIFHSLQIKYPEMIS